MNNHKRNLPVAEGMKNEELSNCDMMNSRPATYFIALTMVGSALCGSHFQLVKESGTIMRQAGSSQARPMDKAFFQCDREARCTYVIQHNETQEYTVVYGDVSTEEMEKMLTVWKKMVVSILPGMNYVYPIDRENITILKYL